MQLTPASQCSSKDVTQHYKSDRFISHAIPSSAERGGDSGQSHPEEVELTERRRWMQGLLRGRFTLGTTHSKPTTPKDGRRERLTLGQSRRDLY